VTAEVAPAERPSIRLTPSTVTLLAIALLAWAGVIAYWRSMGNGAGTMGMPLGEFLPMWGVMMAAMMLPAVAPVASLYVLTIKSDKAKRVSLFVAGYLLAWTVAGIPFYAVLRWIDHVGGDSDTTLRNIAVVALVAAGVYQLTPLKTRCLRHCRSPLGQLLHYGNVKGRFRDLKVAAHHAGFCLACCWGLMVLFFAFGVMSVWAMIGLATVVVGEKVLRQGELLGRVAGVVFLVLALLVLVSPRVADALVPSASMGDTSMSSEMGG
jgi:predicted metal-binding membrane protein